MADESGTSNGGAKGVMGAFSSGELILGLSAAWIFLVVYVVGNRLAEEYGNTSLILPAGMISLGIVAAIYFYNAGGDGTWRTLYPWIVVVAAWGVVVMLALDLLDSVINDDFSSSGEFYEITAYVAAAGLAIGAYMVGQDE